MDISSTELMEQNAPMIRAAEMIVSSTLGRQIKLASMQQLSERGGRSILYRCFSSTESEPAVSFIIKKAGGQAVSADNLASQPMRGFLQDYVGEEFLSSLRLENPVSPKIYGGDVGQGFFVLEDLGEHCSLVEPLLQGDAASAEAGLLKYWTCLGRMHAATAGKAGVYEAMFLEKTQGQGPSIPGTGELETRLKLVQAQMEELGVAADSRLESEIQEAAGAIYQPGPFHVYIHADPCPDNVFDLGDHYRLIDFEFSRFDHALLDAIYPRIIWPSCWCANRLPGDVVARVENSYRAELVRGCPEAQDDAVWESALVNACGMSVLNTLSWALQRALQADIDWGLATGRQRIMSHLEEFIRTSEEFGKLPGLRGAAEQLLSLLRSRWGEIPALPLYPAFRAAF